jgi:hypothetical protein
MSRFDFHICVASNWIQFETQFGYTCELNLIFLNDQQTKSIFTIATYSSSFLQLFKKIDGHETSWALGAAYQELLKG